MEEKEKYEIINDISLNVTLVKLLDTIGNNNHAERISGCWIYDFFLKLFL